MTPETPETPAAPAAPAFSLAALSVAGVAAVPDISNGVPVEWRVKRFSVAEATRAGLLSGVIGAAVAQSQPSGGGDAAPGGAVIESTIRAMLDGGEKAVLAAVTGVRAQGSDVWTDCQIVPVGKGEDPAAGRLSILSVSAAGQIAITQEAMKQALEAVQSVGSFRAG